MRLACIVMQLLDKEPAQRCPTDQQLGRDHGDVRIVTTIDADGGVDDLLCLVMASRLVAKEIARTSFCGNRIALRSGTRPSVRHLTSMRMLLKDAHYSRLPPGTFVDTR